LELAMFAARRPARQNPVPSPIRRRVEPKSLALLVDVVLARYGILPLDPQSQPEPARRAAASPRKQTLLFPVG
jgi:hypothetical protein